MNLKKSVIPHYSSFLRVKGGETIYISGQLPIDTETKKPVSKETKDQVRLALKKMEDIIKTQGGDRYHIVKTVAYTDDISNWEDINEVYNEFFGEHKPTRTIVAVKEIHFGVKVEIEGIAVI
ncbi:RidA family protein [Veillonella criceti]|uniref:Reactive intermediate deaminase TdcF n=1 Tax=Veillonella criceti TaxID=103891 RepID=A0A380NH18_9FIRM|nr:RidA family protein [Veillonella criceti]SUP39474.1 Putative reactive intermediate deaminase TdcF [Veillonella criceti]